MLPCVWKEGSAHASLIFVSLKDLYSHFCIVLKDQKGNLRLPTQQQLHLAGRLDILGALQRAGGWKVVARKLDIQTSQREHRTVDEVIKDVTEFVTCRGVPPNCVPTKAELEEAGLDDLATDITKIGGFRRLAKSLTLNCISEPLFSVEGSDSTEWFKEAVFVNGTTGKGEHSSSKYSFEQTSDAVKNGEQHTNSRPGSGVVKRAMVGGADKERRWNFHCNKEGQVFTTEGFQNDMISSCVNELSAFNTE